MENYIENDVYKNEKDKANKALELYLDTIINEKGCEEEKAHSKLIKLYLNNINFILEKL